MTSEAAGGLKGPITTRDEAQPVGLADSLVTPRYMTSATFARLPRRDQVSRCDIAICGVPFDSGVSYRPGARFGPAAIREGSKLLRPYHPELEIEPFAVQQVADAGDIACSPFNIQEAIAQIEAGVDSILSSSGKVLALGGDHTISLPLLRSVKRRFGAPVVVHFDAHLDTWNTYFGAPFTHGTPFRRAAEEGLLDTQRSVHIGTRGPLYATSDLTDDAALGFGIIRSTELDRVGITEVIERMRSRVGDGPLYVSIDIDVLDPAHAPGTGTPEAGGLSSRELLLLLRGLAGVPIIGADVVEVCPSYDHAQITSLAAAHLVYELIGLIGLEARAGSGRS